MVGFVNEKDNTVFEHHFENPIDYYYFKSLNDSLILRFEFNPTRTIASKFESLDELKQKFILPQMVKTSTEKRNQYLPPVKICEKWDWAHILRVQTRKSEREALAVFLKLLEAAQIRYGVDEIRCSPVEIEHFVDLHTNDIFRTFSTLREGLIERVQSWDFHRVKSKNFFDSVTAYPANEKERCEELYLAVCAIERNNPTSGIVRIESRLFPNRQGFELPRYRIEDFCIRGDHSQMHQLLAKQFSECARDLLPPLQFVRFLQGRKVVLRKDCFKKMSARVKRRHLNGLVVFEECSQRRRVYVRIGSTAKIAMLIAEDSNDPFSTGFLRNSPQADENKS